MTAPLWFKAPFKILRLFVREKLRERVFTVSVPQLSLHVPREHLPTHLGGSLQINHSTWLLHCYKSMTNREDELLSTIGQQSHQQPAAECAGGNDSTPAVVGNAITSDEHSVNVNNQTIKQNGENGANSEGVAVVVANGSSQISEMWSENPPSSASSGFSDDDSLAYSEGDPKSIEQIVKLVQEKGRDGLAKEYAEIRARAPEGTFCHARVRNNMAKNRYTDVLCYDHSRVILSQENDEPTSDYINANFVDGYKQKNAYISTQGKFDLSAWCSVSSLRVLKSNLSILVFFLFLCVGPLPKTAVDFWQMVWDQHCLVIVMTTRVMERGRTKCGQYWETQESGFCEYDNYRIRTTHVDSNEDYTVTTLELTNLKVIENGTIDCLQISM